MISAATAKRLRELGLDQYLFMPSLEQIMAEIRQRLGDVEIAFFSHNNGDDEFPDWCQVCAISLIRRQYDDRKHLLEAIGPDDAEAAAQALVGWLEAKKGVADA